MKPTWLWLRHQVAVPVVLLASLSATAALWQHERDIVARDRSSRLDFDLRELAGRIEQRMAAQAQVLKGVQGLFAASGSLAIGGGTGLERTRLRDYVGALQLGAEFSGQDGIGLALRVPAKQRDAHVAAMQRLGLPGYRIVPAGERADYVPLVQLEPAVAGHQRWLGSDLLTVAAYRDAMNQSRDSGRVAITARLPAESEAGSGAGFAMLAPLYAAGGGGGGVEARRARSVGWVVAPFRVSDLMASLYGVAMPGIDIRIFDGVNALPQALLYDSTSAAAAGASAVAGWADAVEYVVVAGRTWMLAVRTRNGRDGAEPNARRLDRSTLIALTGGGLSVALAVLTWLLATSRARALAAARRMTRELQESESRFRYLAQYDELTQLPNRALFHDRLHQAMAQTRRDHGRLALMFMDLDRFKPVNDTLGHAVGDLLLAAVARRMSACVRESDTVARIGGDEFVVLLPSVRDDADALRVAEKIRHALNEPFALKGGHSVSISSSTGVAFFPEHGDNEDRLSASADHAMYHAKQSGRDRVSVFRAPATAAEGTPA